MRRWFALVGLVLGCVSVEAQATEVRFHRVTAPEVVMPLGVRWCGGGYFSSDDRRVGGLSGVQAFADGRIYLVSDKGYLMEGHYTRLPKGGLDQVTIEHFGPVLGVDGEPLSGLKRDGESIRADEAGRLWVSYERVHRLGRLESTPNGWQVVEEIAIPYDEFGEEEANKGTEAFTPLPGGGFKLVAESIQPKGKRQETVTLEGGREGWRAASYPLEEHFKPTDMVRLSDGSYLMLERSYGTKDAIKSKHRARLMHWTANAIRPLFLADISEQTFFDNMEGLSVLPLNENEQLVLVQADDNYRLWQRSYLIGLCVEIK